MSESQQYNISEGMAFGIGMIVMIVFVLIAIVLFVISGTKTAQYEYLEKETIETNYGVEGIIKEKQKEYQSTYNKLNIVAIILCILSIIPFFIGIMINENDDMIMTSMLSLLLIFSGIGISIFIRTGIVWASYEKILQIGDYTIEKKKTASVIELSGWAYWLIIVTMFLGYSFVTSNWYSSWIILVIGGVLFPAFLAVIKLLQRKNPPSI